MVRVKVKVGLDDAEGHRRAVLSFQTILGSSCGAFDLRLEDIHQGRHGHLTKKARDFDRADSAVVAWACDEVRVHEQLTDLSVKLADGDLFQHLEQKTHTLCVGVSVKMDFPTVGCRANEARARGQIGCTDSGGEALEELPNLLFVQVDAAVERRAQRVAGWQFAL